MKTITLYAAGAVVAVVPAIVGLAGNPSFSQSVPVRSPQHSVGTAKATPAAHPTPRHDANDDQGRRHGGEGADDPVTHDARDDHGGRGEDHSGREAEPRDDHGGDRHRSGSDDHGGHHSGSDDHGGHHSGSDDHGGHGGHGGHGSDD